MVQHFSWITISGIQRRGDFNMMFAEGVPYGKFSTRSEVNFNKKDFMSRLPRGLIERHKTLPHDCMQLLKCYM